MNSYQLLSELYRLLGEADRETVEEARRLAHSPELDAILDALSNAVDRERASSGRNGVRSRRKNHDVATAAVGKDRTEEFATLVERLDIPVAQLVEFLHDCDLPVMFRKGDARSRIVKRATKLFGELPPRSQKGLLSAMRRKSGSETAGWFEVIRNG